MRKTIATAIILLFGIVLFASPAPESRQETQDHGFLAKAKMVTITDTEVTFPDANGEMLTIARKPQKVAVLYPSFTTLWYEAGGVAYEIIGGDSAVELYTTYIGRDITKDEGMTVVASSALAKKWDIETILASQPDLIICSTSMYGYSTIKGPASLAGIPVIAVDYADFADYLKWFRVFSALTGNDSLWDTIALSALEAVENTLASCPDKGPSVLCLFSSSTGLDANTGNTVIGNMLNAMNAVNIVDTWSIAPDAERVPMNLETVYAANPDMILIQCHAGTDVAIHDVEVIYGDNPVWKALDAVKNGRIVYLSRDLFHNKPNRRFAQAYEVLAQCLYGN